MNGQHPWAVVLAWLFVAVLVGAGFAMFFWWLIHTLGGCR